jgi:hypothetical protein
MTATIPGLEKITIAMPLPIFIKDLVGVILSLEGNRKSIDPDPFPFNGILFRLLNFSDQSGIHHFHLHKQINKKHAAEACVH